jgi:hypothetical protein
VGPLYGLSSRPLVDIPAVVRVEGDGLAAAAACAAARLFAVIDTHLPEMVVLSRPSHDRVAFGAADGSTA